MADVKWIKIVTDIFDDEKMLLIESLPSADSIIVIWFKLLCLAGKNNNNGVFIMNDKIAYTDEMLATIFRRDVNTIRLALKTFENYGMIEIIDGVITIPNWGKHQNFDKIEQKNAYMKEYMRDYREKQKKKIENKSLCQNGLSIDEWYEVLKYFNHKCAYCGENNDCLEQEHIIPVNKGGAYCIGNIIPACRHCNSNKGKKDFEKWYKSYELYSDERYKKILDYMCKTNVSDLRKSNVSEAEEEIDKEVEEEIEEENTVVVSLDTTRQTQSVRRIIEKWNELSKYGISEVCRITSSSSRYKMLNARIKEYGEEKVITAIENIKTSDFLKGKGKKGWTITFDWFVRPDNFPKVLENNYSNGEYVKNYQQNTAEMLQQHYTMTAEWVKEMEEQSNDD